MQYQAKSIWFLLLLSVAGIFCVSRVLPALPADLCVGTMYTAYAASSEHPHYLAYLKDQLQPKASVAQAPSQKTEVFAVSPAPTQPNIAPSYEFIQLANETTVQIPISDWMASYVPPKKKSDAPQILIVHTHATEAYAECDNRSLDNSQNMIAIGNVLAQKLTEQGFTVLHDTTRHDYPNYNGSYVNCLKTVEWYLKTYPSIEIVLDVHRDGIENANGTKGAVTTTHNGTEIAQMMLVVGTNQGGLEHPHWQENLKFALGLQARLSALCPTVMRPVNIRNERFNQHTTKNSIIVEVGSNGNSLAQAKASALLLAEALSMYIQ